MGNVMGPWRHGTYWRKAERWEPVGQLAEMKADAGIDAEHRFVTVNADGKAARAGTGAFVVGIGWAQQETPNYEVGVLVTGVAKLLLSAAVARGAQLKSSNSGRGVPTTDDGDNVGAVALEAGDQGDVVQVLVTPGRRY